MSQKFLNVAERLLRISVVVWLVRGPLTTWHPYGIGKQTGILTKQRKESSRSVVGSRSCNSGTLIASNLFPAEKQLQLIEAGMATSRNLRIDTVVGGAKYGLGIIGIDHWNWQ